MFCLPGTMKSWEPHEKVPACSMRMLLTRFLDITTPPSRQLMNLLANYCGRKEDGNRMQFLANVIPKTEKSISNS